MNITKFQLPSIICNHHQTFPILEMVAHAVLFHRTTGIPVIPKEVESCLFDDLVYTIIDDEPIQKKVKEELNHITDSEKKSVLPIVISLYDSVKKYGILGEYYEKLEFERWKVDLHYVIQHSFADEDNMMNQLRAVLDAIMNVHELPGHRPNYDKFSFSIKDASAQKDGSFYDMFKGIPRMFGTP